MSRDKQIDELAEAIFLNCHCGLFEDEAKMIAKFCYQEIDRKSSEVAREIFEDLENTMITYGEVESALYYKQIGYNSFAKLKKKYTEEEKR